MDEKHIRQTSMKCSECDGGIVHDLKYDEKFCLKCGLVISAPYMHEGIE